jgi:transcriptional regulator PpsR
MLSPENLGALDAESAARLVAATGDIAMIIDKDGIIRELAGTNGTLGLGEASWVNKPWSETLTIESRPKAEQLLRDAASGQAARWRELNHAHNGDSVAMRYTALNAGGEGKVIAIGRDHRAAADMQQRLLQAQQAMERDFAKMRDTETRFRHLFQVIADAVVVVDGASRRVTDANEAAGRLLANDGSLAGKQFHRLFAAASQDDAAALLAMAQTSASQSGPQARLVAGGQELTASVSLFRQARTTQYLVRLTPGDQRTVAAPGESARMLEAIDRLPDGFVVTDLDLRILTLNAAFLDMAQLPNAEHALGQPLPRFLGRPGLDRNILHETLVKHGVVRNFPTVVQNRFGEVEDAEVCAVIVADTALPCLGFSIRLVGRRGAERTPSATEMPHTPADLSNLVGKVSLKEIVRDTTDFVERLCIEAALELTGNNRASAAEVLGLSRQSLYSKLRRFGVANLDDGDDED